MIMKSAVIRVRDFLKFSDINSQIFDENIKSYVIPAYQREYKWDETRVAMLLNDIKNRDKFLGNVMLSQQENSYQIVDGQQRITTIMLILIAIFNKYNNGDEAQTVEQQDIYPYIQSENGLILRNDSIGQYLNLSKNKFKLQIVENDDIYYQKSTFDEILKQIGEYIDNLDNLEPFQKKLLDCTLLVLIGKSDGAGQDSIEEIFLDINFKAQLLDVEDIFKGYCFKKYSSSPQDELKALWIGIRKNINGFEVFGYNPSSVKTCEYIYHYLLSILSPKTIQESLIVAGPPKQHYLEDKTKTEIRNFLIEMNDYGNHVLDVFWNVSRAEYNFLDICADGKDYRTDIDTHQALKKMLKRIMAFRGAQYYKLPLFMVLHYLKKDESFRNAFKYNDLIRVLSDYYVYSFLFIASTTGKAKKDIDKTMFEVLYKLDDGESPVQVVTELKAAVRELRKEYIGQYQQFQAYNSEQAFQLYSIIDFYSLHRQCLENIYASPEYNQEHLIIHKNNTAKVDWESSQCSFSFSVEDLSFSSAIKLSDLRKRTSNSLVLPKALNGEILKSKDIVEKLVLIEAYYKAPGREMPAHIKLFYDYITAMTEYKVLAKDKMEVVLEDDIKSHYANFIEAYFSDAHQQKLYGNIEDTLKKVFQRCR